MRTKLWLAACAAVMIGLSGCGDKTKTEADNGGNGGPHGGPGLVLPGGGAGGGTPVTYTAAPLDTKYVAANFSGALILHPERIGMSQFLQPYNLRQRPELQQAEMQMGFNPLDIKRAMLMYGPDLENKIAGVPMTFGVVINFGSDVKDALEQRMTQGLQGVTPETKEHAGNSYTLVMLPMENGAEPLPFAWFFPDARTMVGGTESSLKAMIDGGASGQLIDKLTACDMNADLIAVGHITEQDAELQKQAMEIINQQTGPEAEQIKQAMEAMRAFTQHIDGMTVSIDISGNAGSSLLKVAADLKTEEAATNLKGLADGGIGLAKGMFGQQKEMIKGQLGQVSGANADQHMQVIEALVNGLNVQQSGKTLSLDLKTPDGMVQMVNQLVPTLMQLQAGGAAAPGPGGFPGGPPGAFPGGPPGGFPGGPPGAIPGAPPGGFPGATPPPGFAPPGGLTPPPGAQPPQ